MPAPLTKTSLKGELYRRPAQVDALIDETLTLSRDDLLDRCKIANRRDPAYLPSEVLLHHLRSTRHDNRDTHFERLFRLLLARAEGTLHAAIPDSRCRNADEIRSEIAGRFGELIGLDRIDGDDRLDIFEARFDGALAAMRTDVLRQLGPKRLKTDPIEDPDTGEPTVAAEMAALAFLGPPGEKFDDPAFRSDLAAAIDTLPDDEKQVIGLLLQGIPIDSKEYRVVTIAKMLGCTEKTVRNRRDRAVRRLQDALAWKYAS